MWNRKELKAKAKAAFQANYWVSVAAGLILALFAGASSSSASRKANDEIKDNPLTADMLPIILAVVGVVLVATIIAVIIKIIVGNALIVGSNTVFLLNEESDEAPKFGTIGCIFKNGYWKNVAITMFLRDLFVGLWTLLFIIPGIIKSYEYRMVPYILSEDPETSWSDALAKSKEMMHGNKWEAFVLDLSFIGWFILAGITFSIVGIFYAYPYYYQTQAELYITLKNY